MIIEIKKSQPLNNKLLFCRLTETILINIIIKYQPHRILYFDLFNF